MVLSAYAALPSLGDARAVSRESFTLAEGPVWDARGERLLWVDISSGSILSGRFTAGGDLEVVERRHVPGTAGAVAVSADGELVVTGSQRLLFFDREGTMTLGEHFLDDERRRFNDGKADAQGRFLAGTLGTGSDEVLVRFELDRSVTVLDDDLTMSNGMGWSPDGGTFYNVDTLTRRIFARSYDSSARPPGSRRLLVELDDGYPDGMTVDAEGHLWLALWGAGCVVRIDPNGTIVGRIDVPAPHVTCVTFAGPDLATLVITTATDGLGPSEQTPLSGRLFVAHPDARGQANHDWRSEGWLSP